MPRRVKDLAGTRFGRLVVVEPAGFRESVRRRYAIWLCRCDCGAEAVCRGADLKAGATTSCGCYKLERTRTRGVNRDLSGDVFGKVRVLGFGGWKFREDGARRRALWNCECACGTRFVALGQTLMSGDTTSCGCVRREKLRVIGWNQATHGATRHGEDTPEHISWQAMKQRCLDPNKSNFRYYGGRGITICDRWLGDHGFENFLADMGPKPSPAYSIDRIDNDGNYEPGNCRWATRSQQVRNRRAARLPSV